MTTFRVLVVDDDETFREALVEVLGADRRFEVVGSVGDVDAVAEAVSGSRPHVVLLDVRMPGGGPGTAAAIVEGSRPAGEGPVVVAMSAHTSPRIVASMLRAGAVGYLAKGRLGTTVTDLVARCAVGEVVLAVPGAAEVLRELAQPADPVARP